MKGEPEWWRRTFSSMTGMGLSEEEKRQRKADRDCQKCEQNVAFLRRYSMWTSLPKRGSGC